MRRLEEPVDTTLAHAWVQAIASLATEHEQRLNQLDAVMGDADHGANVRLGFSAAAKALASPTISTIGEVLQRTGHTLRTTGLDASGQLYGAAFCSMAHVLPEPATGTGPFTTALAAGLLTIQSLGAARTGDKTMLDAFTPGHRAFQRAALAGCDFATAARAAADAAEQGMEATATMRARRGRASFFGLRGLGHPDPGAASTALIFQALAQVAAD
ncbi:dihydroxyacetone kinase subunit DhaL [Streptomyces sp. NPDC005728]|uniref:dihydroxyacetone kinase subunit DhaL n=1 Tax=Streptomyces sp. NPDC005728 TaxID=3157054 RepID=UPI0034117EA8